MRIFSLILLLVSASISQAQIFRPQQSVCGPNGCSIPQQVIYNQPVRSYVVPNVVVPAAKVAQKTTEKVIEVATPPYPRIQKINPFVGPSVGSFENSLYSFENTLETLHSVEVQSLTVEATSKNQFSKLVQEATKQQRELGNITLLQQIRINTASRLPRLSKEMETMLAAEFAVETNAQGLIDWENFDPDKFLEFVKAIILILKLFGIGV
jgi:hypothetical protein